MNNVQKHLPLLSKFIKPTLLSYEASITELLELVSLLDGGIPTFPRSAIANGSLVISFDPNVTCCKPPKFKL